MTLGLTKGGNLHLIIMLNLNQSQDWIFRVLLVTCTCKVLRNMLSRICLSIGRHFKSSFDALKKLTQTYPLFQWAMARARESGPRWWVSMTMFRTCFCILTRSSRSFPSCLCSCLDIPWYIDPTAWSNFYILTGMCKHLGKCHKQLHRYLPHLIRVLHSIIKDNWILLVECLL